MLCHLYCQIYLFQQYHITWLVGCLLVTFCNNVPISTNKILKLSEIVQDSVCCSFINSFSNPFFKLMNIILLIAYPKKYLQSDWLRGLQYWPYLYSVFNICTLWLNKKKKIQHLNSVAEKQKCIQKQNNSQLLIKNYLYI